MSTATKIQIEGLGEYGKSALAEALNLVEGWIEANEGDANGTDDEFDARFALMEEASTIITSVIVSAS